MCMADRIKNRRLEMGLTQEELATRLGLQKSAIAKYENGRVENIKRSIISKMAEILECKPSYLMGWEPYHGGSEKYIIFEEDQTSLYIPKDADAEYGEQENQILQYFSGLNEENRKKVIKYCQNIQSIQNMDVEQEHFLNAAHEDEYSTPDERKASDAIMTDDSEWE